MQNIPLFFLIALLGCCSCKDDNSGGEETPYTRITASGIDGTRIAWDYSSMRQLATEGGYARIRLLAGGLLAAVYEGPGGAFIRESRDGGATWGESRKVVAAHTYTSPVSDASVQVDIANPELIRLGDGTLLFGVNYRPAQEGIAPFAIAVCRSDDDGATWSAPLVLYEAGTSFGDGCWEPAFLELPDGTVQVYFANEGPYRTSDEQEISMLSSSDGGRTWTGEPVTVCFRSGHRDGMPVPAIFGEEIVVAVEDNGFGEFCPATVRTKIGDGWMQPVSGDSPQRSLCLQTANPNPVYMGAPYLVKALSGEAFLSYQSTRDRTSQWEMSVMEVAVGDAEARNFGRTTRPFDIPSTAKGLWNSLCPVDEGTVIAVTSSDFRGAYSPWMIKGYPIPDLKAERRSITVEGDIGVQEWGGSFPIFVGHRGQTNMRAAIAFDEGYLYLCAQVNEAASTESGGRQDDGVTFYIDAKNACLTAPDKGIYRVKCFSSGQAAVWTGARGAWVECPFRDVRYAVRRNERGYVLELGIPFAGLDLTELETMRLAVALAGSCNGESYDEIMANANVSMPYTWSKLDFNQ